MALAKKFVKAKKALSPYSAGYEAGKKEMIRRFNEINEYKKTMQPGDGFIGMAKKKKLRA